MWPRRSWPSLGRLLTGTAGWCPAELRGGTWRTAARLPPRSRVWGVRGLRGGQGSGQRVHRGPGPGPGEGPWTLTLLLPPPSHRPHRPLPAGLGAMSAQSSAGPALPMGLGRGGCGQAVTLISCSIPSSAQWGSRPLAPAGTRTLTHTCGAWAWLRPAPAHTTPQAGDRLGRQPHGNPAPRPSLQTAPGPGVGADGRSPP